jgi:hypothetical protein
MPLVGPNLLAKNNRSIIDVSPHYSEQICVLASITSDKSAHSYTILMYPWSAKLYDITWVHSKLKMLVSGSMKTNLRGSLRSCLEESMLVLISYRDIYTIALESRHHFLLTGFYSFANAWKETWGRIIKWETYEKKAKYEFFVPNVTSKAELQNRLENLLAWVDDNIT